MSSSKVRVRVSQACNVCKVKKIKCDGAIPQCRTCVINQRACAYGISKRNTRLNKTSLQSIHSPDPAIESRFPENDTPDRSALEQTQSPVDALSRAEKESLFRTYFACIHPIWPLIYKPIYDSVNLCDLTDVLPNALVYAMFSIASCIRSDPATAEAGNALSLALGRADATRNASKFFDAALLEIQRDGNDSKGLSLATALNPSIPKCQVLALLALQQHGVAEFAHAGIFCSLAAAMAVELRLHRDTLSNDAVEKEVASRLWWNIYILDKMLASEMGRPIVLRYEDCDTPYPSTCESDEFELFSLANGRIPPGQERVPSMKLRTISAFHTTIHVSKLEEKVTREIYSLAARESIRRDRSQGDNIRMAISFELDGWENSAEQSPLRLSLNKDALAPPAMVTNYVALNYIVILLHRPFIAHWQQHKEITGQAPFNTSDPAKLCIQAAKKICLILETHSAHLPRLPSDLIFIIFTVASVLLRHSQQLLHADPELAQIHQYTKRCISWLRIFANNWKNADARQDILNKRYTWPASFNGVETSDPISVDLSSQPINAFNLDQASEFSFDETNFADILNEIEDWEFLQQFGDAPYAYTM